ncbi:MAG: hypothetical protein KAQ99_06755 [Candidatus Aureabacteria bacterium]|nr:hypothetical protein [Candidatus Auribacterota bacterium]MCK5161259.1 hypothetical protein [Candidatus Auribacterota bacterium]
MRLEIKMSSMTGTARPVTLRRVLPKDKQAKELFIAEQFARVQTIAGAVLTEIRINPDDSEGKADVLAKANGKLVGVQLTELKIQHRPASADRARKMTEALLSAILNCVQPDYRIMVNIRSSTDYRNENLKIVGKRIEMLGKTIASGIEKSSFSPSPADYFDKTKTGLRPNPLPIPEGLKDVITGVELQKIPEGDNTLCHGRNNIFINFNFDIVVASDEMDERLVSQVFEKKEKSVADTLLIWVCDRDFWGQQEKIYKLFVAYADKSQFDNIYLFFFIDAEKIFDANKKVYVVRERK